MRWGWKHAAGLKLVCRVDDKLLQGALLEMRSEESGIMRTEPVEKRRERAMPFTPALDARNFVRERTAKADQKRRLLAAERKAARAAARTRKKEVGF